jgi:hypothetical protein
LKPDIGSRPYNLHNAGMTIQARAATAFSTMALAMTACAHSARPAAFDVKVRGPASSCSIEVAGRTVTTDELLTIGRHEATKGRRAHIDSNMEETPYRCLGGVIYTLQRAGFRDVGFIAEPPKKP